jgi:tetratricopeptide (TPR) repeat protein
MLVVAGLSTITGCSRLRARDLLNKGVEAYKEAQFDESEEDFRKAAELDPKLLTARLYLATAYASQYVPGISAEENQRKGQQAVIEFQKALQDDPTSLSAIDGIGSMLYRMASKSPVDEQKLEESKQYHEKHIQLQPNDPDPYYWVAVIDWTIARSANEAMRDEYNQNPKARKKGKGPKELTENDALPEDLRTEFATKYGPVVDEGISDANKAIQLRPDDTDAMAYLNLLDRQKADIVASATDRQDLLKQANALVDKVKEVKEKQAAPRS